MENIPVVMLQGPRMVGKSTLLREMARPTGNAVLDLDSPMVMEESPFDTERFLSAPKPFFVDEYQKDPDIPQHIKAVLNRDGSNGRFVLTCSVRRETPFSGIKPLTGRLYSLPVAPLAQAEIAGVPGNFLSAAFEDVESLIPGVSTTSREQYIDKMLTGGFPMALAAHDEDDRALWFAHYVRTAITEDARSLVRFHQADRLYRLLRRLAAQTGQALNIAKAASEADLGERTALNHARLLEDIFMLELLSAWTKTDTGPTGRPKVYVLDSGVAARFLGLTGEKLRSRDPYFSPQFGQLVKTFAVGEIRKMASWPSVAFKMGYWRGRNGAGVDLVVEHPRDESVIGMEIKAGQRVGDGHIKGLAALREEAGDRFRAGLLLNMGERARRLDDGIYAMPMDRLWRDFAENPQNH